MIGQCSQTTKQEAVGKTLSPAQLCRLSRFGGRVSKFGANFAVCSIEGQLLLLCRGGSFESDGGQLIELAQCALRISADSSPGAGSLSILEPGEGVWAVVLKPTASRYGRAEPVAVALIDLSGFPDSDTNGHKDGRQQMRELTLKEMLELFAESYQTSIRTEQQIEKVSSELAQTYEELVLLHKLSTNMKVTEADANFLQMACDCLTEIVPVEGIAILLDKTVDGERKLVLAAGSGLLDIDERMAVIMHCRLIDEINAGKEALLDSAVDSPLKYEWPENVKSIIAVPLYGTEKAESHLSHVTRNGDCIIGMMAAINRADKPDFDSTDVKLFNSVAGGCAVFVENGRLFSDLKELFIGSLKALTSSIDAKDRYTHGHSERVAFISRWIAEKYYQIEPFEHEQIHRIYLAGLLHDIGKIGIDEVVLRKNGKLTEEELQYIRRHPAIGAGILGEIKQMRDIIPGVLCHHERPDGKGYPNGLTGDKIPLIGKIVGLADSFDAMTSRRTYRDARSVEQALAEIEKGIGTQFDEKVARVFLQSDVYQLWDIIQNGEGEIYHDRHASKYGTAAVGVLIR